MRYALTINGKVRDIIVSDDVAAEFSPGILANLVESDTAQRGQLYDGSTFSDPPPRVPEWWEGRRLNATQTAHLLDCIADIVDGMEAAAPGQVTAKMNAVRTKIRQLQSDYPEA